MSDYYDRWSELTREQKSRLYRIENDNSFDNIEDISCPYCNTKQRSLDEGDIPYEQDNELEYECWYCDKAFIITAQVSYSWDTKVPHEEALVMLEVELKESKNE